MIYFCCDKRRRDAVRAHGSLNGIEYLEVLDRDAPPGSPPQRTLLVRFLNDVIGVSSEAVHIQGGRRITSIGVDWAFPAPDVPSQLITTGEQEYLDRLTDPGQVLVVRTSAAGDFSTYRLRLGVSKTSDEPLPGFDPILSAVDFTFKVECPAPFDCRTTRVCPPNERAIPQIDYLAKDYASFRRLILDRLSLLAPEWRERSPADLGITLVELLAYVGDYLSYQQDAIATEAYLNTARRRVSVRRHLRLIDQFLHDGCNARVWVRVRVEAEHVRLPRATKLLTRTIGFDARLPSPPSSDAFEQAVQQGATVFETMQDATLFKSHDRLSFYTWGDRDCCLPRGATGATLHGALPLLTAGEVLILAEVKDPETGKTQDADLSKRHAVRLTHVTVTEDPAGGRFQDPPGDNPVPVTRIQWSVDDALPFAMCVSATINNEPVDDVSIAWGNIVLADHGRSVDNVGLGTVPQPHLFEPAGDHANDRCTTQSRRPIPARYRPALPDRPLTHATRIVSKPVLTLVLDAPTEADLDAHKLPAGLKSALRQQGVVLGGAESVQGGFGHWSISSSKMALVLRRESDRLLVCDVPEPAGTVTKQDPDHALPALELIGRQKDIARNWVPRRDLLASGPRDPHCVVETEHDRTARLRFGDDRHGQRPEPETAFTATFRIGNGPAGNVGVDAVQHVVSDDAGIVGVTNPLPAAGGTDPQSVEQARQHAPRAFRRQERAVTPDDYAEFTRRPAGVQQAAATLRWTGSWHTVFVTVDRTGGAAVDSGFESGIRKHLERYRMAGHDLEVDGPRHVSLEIEMVVCVRPDHFRSDVKTALLAIFNNRALSDGRRGVFHPDNFSFGQPVYLSPLYAAAHKTPGVDSVEITTFQRLGAPDKSPLRTGKLVLDRLEIARLDNDPNFPEHGVLRLVMRGGK